MAVRNLNKNLPSSLTHVLVIVQAIEAKAKKVPKQTPDFKAALEAFQELLNAAAEDLAAQAAAAAATAISDLPAAGTSPPPRDASADTASAQAQQCDSQLPPGEPSAEGALLQTAAADSRQQQDQAELDGSDLEPPAGQQDSADVSGLEQQMSSLAMTDTHHAPPTSALEAHSDPLPHGASTSSHSAPDPNAAGEVAKGERRSGQQEGQECPSSVPDMEDGPDSAAVSAALHGQQHDRASLSQSSALMGPDIPRVSMADGNLPATQLQDSELPALSQVRPQTATCSF